MQANAVRKVMWLAKSVALFGGFAVGLAFILGVATTALAAVPGDPFELGQTNTINNAFTKLVGSNDGDAMLKVDNNSSAGGSRALDLRVEAGKAPLNVNSDAGKATNLNSDELDGKGADQIGVNGLEVVSDTTFPASSNSGRFARVDCPDGKVVVGTGYFVGNGTTGSIPNVQTDISVTNVDPDEDSVYVSAYEEEPTSEAWTLSARAICATEGTP